MGTAQKTAENFRNGAAGAASRGCFALLLTAFFHGIASFLTRHCITGVSTLGEYLQIGQAALREQSGCP